MRNSERPNAVVPLPPFVCRGWRLLPLSSSLSKVEVLQMRRDQAGTAISVHVSSLWHYVLLAEMPLLQQKPRHCAVHVPSFKSLPSFFSGNWDFILLQKSRHWLYNPYRAVQTLYWHSKIAGTVLLFMSKESLNDLWRLHVSATWFMGVSLCLIFDIMYIIFLRTYIWYDAQCPTLDLFSDTKNTAAPAVYAFII